MSAQKPFADEVGATTQPVVHQAVRRDLNEQINFDGNEIAEKAGRAASHAAVADPRGRIEAGNHDGEVVPPQTQPGIVFALQEENAELRAALAARLIIEQATGAVTVRLGTTPEGAFELMRGFARAQNRSLHEFAAEVMANGGQLGYCPGAERDPRLHASGDKKPRVGSALRALRTPERRTNPARTPW